jgi:iron-sulfur cluster repair protein YtfE (RIC family)
MNKRDKSELTKNEYKELLRITDKVEQLEAKRIQYLSQLAKLRKTTLSNLMRDIGIKEPEII